MLADENIIISAIKYCLVISWCILCLSSAYNLNINEAIVFSDPYKRTVRGSYFGWSVALYHGPRFSNPSVLVGAPRADIKNIAVNEPGSVFKCILDGSCKEWIVDNTNNNSTGFLTYGSQIRDHSWLGANIAVENKDYPKVLICAPRWILSIWYIVNQRYMTGICYQTTVISPYTFEKTIDDRIKPLTNYSYLSARTLNGQIVPHWGMGELGLSVHTISDEPRWNAVLGSPGMYTWYGVPVIVSEVDYHTFVPTIPDFSWVDREYLGYAVTSGHYFGGKKRAYAASAPRSDDMKGRVVIFNDDEFDNGSTMKLNILSGTQHSEYFGAAITSCDIDGDKKDELIVGAPLWTKNGDEGRIYVFSSKSRKLLELSSWIDGKVVDGRFGSSVVCLGDIDQDGFSDVAVGAPYEEGHGAVYIFNGHSNGLLHQWSQRITGKQFPFSLRGFGISISEPRDIDGNGYNDIAIGAYQSGHAVLLRTHPVVSVFVTLSNNDKITLRSNSTSFSIQICCTYEGVHAPTYLKIIKKLKIDPILGRATVGKLMLNNGTYDWHDVLYYGVNTCKKLEIFLQSDMKNVIDPIIISASLELNPIQDTNSTKSNTFCSTCPVLNRYRSKIEDSLKIPFAVDCGSDNICFANLTLNVSTNLENDNRYVIGTSKIVKIFIDVHNYGEAAYQSEVSIIFPKHLALASVPISCIEGTTNTDNLDVTCTLGNPFMTEKNISLDVDMSQVKTDEKSVEIFIKVSTQSENVIPIPIQHNLTIYFDLDADITVAGKAQDSLYSFVNEKKEIDNTGKETLGSMRFQHVYEVQKFGATPIQQSTLKILVPTAMITNKKNIEIVSINDTSISRIALSGKLNSHCTQRPRNLTKKWGYLEATDDLIDTGFSDEIFNLPPDERTLYLNCSNPLIVCKEVYCVFESPTNSSTIAEVTLTMDLLLNNFNNTMDGKDIIYFVSNGRASITMPKGIIQKIDHKPDYFQVKTTFVGSPVASQVATWVIALSVFLGILLLILLTFGLIKLGFFDRKKKEALEALKANENTKEGFVLETTSSREALSD
ncbi:integrin alpha-4-like [Chelonus insularis]|uniref:integrin alpha-4-like n=1 Tax=Chelonus insularis TaxID=460826 RepID=UPI00158CDB1B|nr:integrin alpha-4-like [Chelonus insularis]